MCINHKNRLRVLMSLAVYGVGVVGCERLQSHTTQGAAIGSAVGAATGAIVGHKYKETGAGMSVGAGLGGVAGTLAGSALDAHQKPQPSSASPSSSTAAVLTKFCPIGGELYPEQMKYCPLHGVELRHRDAAQTATGQQ